MLGSRLQLAAVALALVAAIATAGCGSSSNSSGTTTTVHFAKTKFLLHAGLAFGAFHRYIYKPYKAGGFSPPLQHKAALVKAGAAALFAYHETKIALTDARSSRLLSTVLSPLLAFQDKLRLLGGRLKSGSLDTAGIESANGSLGAVQGAASAAGASVKDRSAPIP